MDGGAGTMSALPHPGVSFEPKDPTDGWTAPFRFGSQMEKKRNPTFCFVNCDAAGVGPRDSKAVGRFAVIPRVPCGSAGKPAPRPRSLSNQTPYSNRSHLPTVTVANCFWIPIEPPVYDPYVTVSVGGEEP